MFNRPQSKLSVPSASIEEAAAILAALERFERDTGARPASVGGQMEPWARAAILEGVSPQQQGDGGDPWIKT
jgi:hypothetical protein